MFIIPTSFSSSHVASRWWLLTFKRLAEAELNSILFTQNKLWEAVQASYWQRETWDICGKGKLWTHVVIVPPQFHYICWNTELTFVVKKLIHSLTFLDFPLCLQLFLHHCDQYITIMAWLAYWTCSHLTTPFFPVGWVAHPNLGEENKNQPGDWAKIVWFELRCVVGFRQQTDSPQC